MKSKVNNLGFTIVETVLFLAISGILILTVLAGTSISIKTQRYRDSVNSLVSVLQTEYTEVANPMNSGQTSNHGCNIENGELKIKDGGQFRGQSDCLVVGRYIESTPDDGHFSQLKMYTIYAKQKSDINKPTTLSDFYWGRVEDSEYKIPWEAHAWIHEQPEANKSKLLIAIIRNPINNQIETRHSYSGFNDVFNDELSSKDKIAICIKGRDLIAGIWQSVEIARYASGPSGVERKGDAAFCGE